MANERYFYKNYWDTIYNGNLYDMPWIGECKKAPFIKDFFDDIVTKNKFKNAKILDVGCGDGSLCEYLSVSGYENITGIDVSEVIINKCKDKKDSKVKYVRKDIVNEHFDSKEKYDIIICWFLLHHIKKEDVEKFTIKLFNLCNPNGILILSSLYHDGMESRDSYFSDLHQVIYYTDKEVNDSFFPYFRNIEISKCELYKKPDDNNEKYPYCAVKLVRNELKSVLDGKIDVFKKSAIEAKPEELQNLTKRLIALLNEISFYTNFTNELSEEDFSHLFDRLFRNVSRFLCKRIENKKDDDKEKNDVIILKLDSFLNDTSGGRIFSATMYDEKEDIHCRFNEYANQDVKSRAYDLFLEYSKYLKTENLSEDQQYSLHKHFADDPSLPFIVFDKTKIENHKLFKDICGYENYYYFLKSFFDNFEQDNTEKKGFLKHLLNKNKNLKEVFGDVANSFLCFNLGVIGFESWGTLMIESKEKWDTILKLFYEVENAENDKNNNGDEYAYKKETELLRNIKDIIFILKKIDYDCYRMLSDRKLKKEAIKSAIAALMARNMSHNLGSHPLTNTKNYFRKRIDEVISEDRYNCADVGADYRGNVHLLQYIKERMDFIATVVSSDQYPFGALNFKAQLFDVLTEDDHGQRHKKRTQNFLLRYLVFSEKLTRYTSDMPENYKEVLLKVIYNGETYTGDVDEEENENTIKLSLSNLELAVPGGLMGRHAFFCIIENIARNSAKHSKKVGDLVITIKMKPNKDKTKMDISIFDNRKGGKKVREEIEKHLKKLVILNEEDTRVNKDSKGLKEMLICALWLGNENVAEKLYEIQSEKDGEKKIELIKKYLDVSLVDKNGVKKENGGNLCYTIKNIPLFEICYQLEKGKDYEVVEGGIRLVENKLVNLHADIVAADKDYLVFVKDNKEERHLSDIFPRFVNLSRFKKEKKKWDEAYQAKDCKILFKMFDEKSNAKLLKKNPTIHTDSDGIVEQIDRDDAININVKKGNITDSDWTIFFKNHLESDVPAKDKQDVVDKGKGKYLESESGENFTSTITTNDFLEDAINRYKVVEAANTRIAIIDERIYGDFQTRWNGDVRLEQQLLEMRGIYLLNYENGKIIDLQGEEFNKKENINFVSIHLGLLDKKKKKVNIKTDILDKYFDEKTFVSIHSGRGNFSADLEGKLKNYPFISLSALEAAFYDCKYFLTQLFKTTNYYGKGNIIDK